MMESPTFHSKKKSFKDLKNDLNSLSDALSENHFVADIGRRMFIKMKDIGPEVFTNLIYAIADEASFELMIEDVNKYEKVVLSLEDFYTFYNLIVTYSMTASMKPANREQYNQNNEDLDENNVQWNSTYPSARPRSSTLNDGKICAICFSKSIQMILPCTHGFCEDCCAGWYEKKQKTECPMCRTPTGEGVWYGKAFEIMSKDTIKEKNQQGGKGVGKSDIFNFINKRTKSVKLH